MQLKPEERTRQLWVGRLINQYGYPVSRIAVEYPIIFGRDSSKRADIIVFDADRPTVPYIIIEMKQGKLCDGKEQLRSYAAAGALVLVLLWIAWREAQLHPVPRPKLQRFSNQ